MYGTISRFRLKSDGLEALEEMAEGGPDSAGAGAMAIFQMDSDPREIYAVAIAESEQAYRAMSESPEMHKDYLERLRWMESEPEWNDGKVIYFQNNGVPKDAQLYGTIVEMKVKPGARQALLDSEEREDRPDSILAVWALQMDADPDRVMMVAIAESEEDYRAYSESDESHRQYLEMLESLEQAPTWHDGRVVDYRVELE